MVNCPKCNRIIMDTTQDGGYKVRSRMILFKDGEATAICPTCKSTVPVPLAIAPIENPRPKTRLIVNS